MSKTSRRVPDWISIDELKKDSGRGMQNATSEDCDDAYDPQYAAAASRRAFGNIAFAQEGCRNKTLNREAFNLSRFIVAGTLDLTEVLDDLCCAAIIAGLESKETSRTIHSAMRSVGIIFPIKLVINIHSACAIKNFKKLAP